MSRTFKTDPYRVKLHDPRKHKVVLREVHHHEKTDGECQLADSPLVDDMNPMRWCWYDNVSNGRNVVCGCKMCTGQVGRKAENAGERKRVNNKLAQAKYTGEFD